MLRMLRVNQYSPRPLARSLKIQPNTTGIAYMIRRCVGSAVVGVTACITSPDFEHFSDDVAALASSSLPLSRDKRWRLKVVLEKAKV